MQEIIIDTTFDGSESSLLMTEQALALYDQKTTAVQIKNHGGDVDFFKNHGDLKQISESKVIENAPHIYDMSVQILNPNTHNILLLPNMDFKNYYNYKDKISKFDEIWVADESIYDAEVVIPNIMVYDDIKMDICDAELNILCNFPKIDGWRSFFEAYIQIEAFEKANLILISDVNMSNFIGEIKEIKKKYNKNNKIKLLSQQTPMNVNHCIINSDIFILPFNGNNGWSLFAAHGAALEKQVILTSYSCMAKNIHNCDIIMDLPVSQTEKSVEIWKLFLENLEMGKKSSLIDKGVKFSERVQNGNS